MEPKQSHLLSSKVFRFSGPHRGENRIKELGCIRNELEEAGKSLADIKRSSYKDTDSCRSDSPITDNSIDQIKQTLVVVELAKMEISTILYNFSTEEKNLVRWQTQQAFSKVDPKKVTKLREEANLFLNEENYQTSERSM
jgi:D-mannonate dehydratase